MATIRINDPNGDKLNKLKGFLPEKNIIDEINDIMTSVYFSDVVPKILDVLKKEIEVFRKMPKPDNIFNIDSFNPLQAGTCFMGQGFGWNGSYTNEQLRFYREKVGTIEHAIWGDCTILEIWGAEHFITHKKMVLNVFKYCTGQIQKMPVLKVHENIFKYTLNKHRMNIDFNTQNEALQVAVDKAFCFDNGIKLETYLKAEKQK